MSPSGFDMGAADLRRIPERSQKYRAREVCAFEAIFNQAKNKGEHMKKLLFLCATAALLAGCQRQEDQGMGGTDTTDTDTYSTTNAPASGTYGTGTSGTATNTNTAPETTSPQTQNQNQNQSQGTDTTPQP
jgi:hypothetical protein